MKSVEEINSKLNELKARKEELLHSESNNMQAFCEVYQQVRLLEWVLSIKSE